MSPARAYRVSGTTSSSTRLLRCKDPIGGSGKPRGPAVRGLWALLAPDAETVSDRSPMRPQSVACGTMTPEAVLDTAGCLAWLGDRTPSDGRAHPRRASEQRSHHGGFFGRRTGVVGVRGDEVLCIAGTFRPRMRHVFFVRRVDDLP